MKDCALILLFPINLKKWKKHAINLSGSIFCLQFHVIITDNTTVYYYYYYF